ncbi:MAG: 30S ribosome-binding factor RbfA [Azospirillaceae bacterium]
MTDNSAKMPSQRQLRVGEEIRHVLAEPLLHGQLRDPELDGVSITVSEVRVSPDLKNATAFVMPLGGGHAEDVVGALNRAAPYLRGLVARSVRLRHAPRLGFRLDTSFEEGQKIDRLLASASVRRDVGEGDGHTGDDGGGDGGGDGGDGPSDGKD